MGQSDFGFINGGVCAAKGFKAGGVHCGIRKNKGKKDLALIVCDTLCDAAAVYTTNLVKGAPLIVTKRHLENGKAQAVICNSGNANTCVEGGIEHAEEMAELVEQHTFVKADDVIVASTGVIGVKLDINPIKNGINALVESLKPDGSTEANLAIMTTDTVTKECAVQFNLGGKICSIGGIAKGSGMIHPNMATMLVFLTTDAAVSSEMLQKAISEDVNTSFNMVSVDGDTSTNDMLCVMASGLAGNEIITDNNADFQTFCYALSKVTRTLCKKIAADGEGATKLLICSVNGAAAESDAQKIAKSVITSSLLKAAIFGSDANWGRVLCALGYSGANVNIETVTVSFASAKGEIEVCKNGSGINFDEAAAKEILSEKEITVKIALCDGIYCAEAWGCDLSYDYVRINGDYRT